MVALKPGIRYVAEGGIARITLDNPEKHNAMTLAMWQALPEAVAQAEADPAIRVIAVSGAGEKAFCSGADISEFGTNRASEADIVRYNASVAAANAALSQARKPTVALVRGICFGGGFGLALCCDLRLVTRKARFRIPAARVGLGYGYTGIEALVRRIGMAGVADLLLSAGIVGAEDALRYGIAMRVWDDEAFEAEAAAYLAGMASNAPLTMQAIKRALGELMRPEAERDVAAVDALVAQCFESFDYREGQKAFLEKRAPVFRGH